MPDSASLLPPTPPEQWPRLHLWQIQPVRDLLVLVVAVFLVWLGHRLSVVTVPMLLALLLAYLVEPLVSAVVRRRWMTRRGSAIAIILLSVIALVGPIGIGGGFAAWQGVRLAGRTVTNIDRLLQSVSQPENEELRGALPQSWRNVRERIVKEEPLRRQLAALAERTRRGEAAAPSPDATPDGQPALPPPTRPLEPADLLPPGTSPAGTSPPDIPAPPDNAEAAREPSDLGRMISFGVAALRDNAATLSRRLVVVASGLVGGVFAVFTSAFAFVFGAFLTAFFFFFFCTGYGEVETFWAGLIPERRKNRTIDLIQQMDKVIAGFVRGRLTVAAAMVVVYTACYALIGVPAPLIVGPIMGLLTIVPYASTVAAPIAMALMWLDPAGGWRGEWWWIIGGPLLVLGIAQFLDDYVLSPIIQGKATNMDTPTILFASIAGGALAGVYGVLVAIPVAACLKILLREVFWPRFKAWTEGRAPDILPIRET